MMIIRTNVPFSSVVARLGLELWGIYRPCRWRIWSAYWSDLRCQSIIGQCFKKNGQALVTYDSHGPGARHRGHVKWIEDTP